MVSPSYGTQLSVHPEHKCGAPHEATVISRRLGSFSDPMTRSSLSARFVDRAPDRPSNSIMVDSACVHASTSRLGRYTRRLRPTGMVNVSISSTPSPLANGSATQAPIFSVRR